MATLMRWFTPIIMTNNLFKWYIFELIILSLFSIIYFHEKIYFYYYKGTNYALILKKIKTVCTNTSCKT